MLIRASSGSGGGGEFKNIGYYGQYGTQTQLTPYADSDYLSLSTTTRPYDTITFNKNVKGIFFGSEDSTAYTLNNVTFDRKVHNGVSGAGPMYAWEFTAQANGTITRSGGIYYGYDIWA